MNYSHVIQKENVILLDTHNFLHLPLFLNSVLKMLNKGGYEVLLMLKTHPVDI